jgi:hypothetical protein
MVNNFNDVTTALCKNFKACTEYITKIGTTWPTYTHIQVGDVRMHAKAYQTHNPHSHAQSTLYTYAHTVMVSYLCPVVLVVKS